MHLALTLAAFLLLTAVMILLRLAPLRFPETLRRVLLGLGSLSLLIFVLCLVSHRSFTLPRLNGALYWTAVATYEFLLLRSTHLKSRLLNSIIVTVLLLPLLSDSLFLPLTQIFDPTSSFVTPINDRLYWERRTFASDRTSYSGVDLGVYSHSPALPLLRHSRLSFRLLNTQCDAASSTATLQPDGRSVRVICPAWPGEEGMGGSDVIAPLE